jgi:hypothetical protein
MFQKYENLRQQILTFHDLHRKWLPSEIADELINSDCPLHQKIIKMIRHNTNKIKFKMEMVIEYRL